jgi:heme exporter protein D
MKLVFQFPDFQSFMWMDGHGPYVWGSYAITFLALALLVAEPLIQRKRFIREQQGLVQRETSTGNDE